VFKGSALQETAHRLPACRFINQRSEENCGVFQSGSVSYVLNVLTLKSMEMIYDNILDTKLL